MGKKRKKSSQAPSVAPSQPALTEEAAAALVGEVEAKPVEETKPVVEAAPEPEPVKAEPVKATPPKPEAAPEPIVAPEPAPEPVIEAAPAAAPVSEAAPETARPKKRVVKKKKRPAAPAVTREALDQKIDRLEAKLEEKKEEVAKAAREAFGSNPALDDTSVPPVDLEIHDEFFAAGERPHSPPKEASGAYTALDARHAQKMTAHAVARRAHLSRYVKWVVGGAVGILLLGFTIKSMRHRSDEPIVRQEVTHVAQATQATEANVAKAAEPQAVVAPPPKTDTDEAKVEDKADEAKTATNEAKPEGSAAEKTAEPSDQPKGDLPPEKPKNAYQEKVSAKAALERGANGAAIAAGERSVSLDPSDAEAWLVLGAAYQASGNVGQAKRCFKSCVSQGKRGPVSDCRDMLSSL